VKAYTRRRQVEAQLLGSGNWLVTEEDGSRVSIRPEVFHELFELEDEEPEPVDLG
jgi:hypothetical protein